MGRAVGDFSGVLDLPAVLEASTAVRSASSLLAGLQGQPLQCASFVQLFCSVEGDLQARWPWQEPPGSTWPLGLLPRRAIPLYAGSACWGLCAPAPVRCPLRTFPTVCEAANWLASKRAGAAGARDHEGAGRAPGAEQRQQRQRLPAAGGADEGRTRTLASVLHLSRDAVLHLAASCRPGKLFITAVEC